MIMAQRKWRGHKTAPAWILALAILFLTGCATTGEPKQNDTSESQATEQQATERDGPDVVADGDIEPDVVAYREYRDPLIKVNRAVFAFNSVAMNYLLIPASKGYQRAVPSPVRTGIGNFFYNLKTPVYAGNHLLQLKPKPMGINLLRFGINTTIGLLGIFDPAKHWFDLEKQPTNFEDTLVQYGSGYGVYLVLPFLGPSDIRNSTSRVFDYFLNPIVYLTDNPETLVIQSFDFFQEFAPSAEQLEALQKEAEDPYIFFRNMYLQGIQRDEDY